MKTRPFLVASSYRTKAGNHVRIVDENTLRGYECVCGDDGIWRYNRESDRGRTTGTAFDMSDPRNLIPEPSLNEGANAPPDF